MEYGDLIKRLIHPTCEFGVIEDSSSVFGVRLISREWSFLSIIFTWGNKEIHHILSTSVAGSLSYFPLLLL